MVLTTDWTNIPHYPTTREKRENVAKYLVSMGRSVPAALARQIEEDRKKEVEEDAYNVAHNQMRPQQPQHQPQPQAQHQYQHPHIQPHQQQVHRNPPHIYSREYAAYIGARPRAQPSANVRLGGVI